MRSPCFSPMGIVTARRRRRWVDVGAQAPAAWTTIFGLTGYPGSAPHMVEDTSTGAHAIVHNLAGWASGRAQGLYQIKFTTRNSVKVGLGGNYVVLNSNGTPSNFTAGVTGAWQESDGAGGFFCGIYVPAMATNVGELYIDSPANTDVYTGNGSGVDFLQFKLRQYR